MQLCVQDWKLEDYTMKALVSSFNLKYELRIRRGKKICIDENQ